MVRMTQRPAQCRLATGVAARVPAAGPAGRAGPTGSVTRRLVVGRAAAVGEAFGAGSLLAACQTRSIADSAQPAAGPVEIRHVPQNSVKDEEAFRRIAEAFNQRQQKVRVVAEAPGDNSYVKLDTLIAGGMPPDAAWTQGSQWMRYLAQGVLLDLAPIVSKDRSFPADKIFIKAHDEQTKFRGKTYVMPLNTGGFALYFNKDLFDRAGVRYPSDGWTWDDWFRTAEKLTSSSGDQKQWGHTVYSNYKWNVPWMKQIQKEGWDRPMAPAKCQLDDPAIVDAMRRQADMRLRYQYAPMPADGTDFYKGRVAMNISGEWEMWRLRQEGRVKWDVAVLPRNKRAATLLFVQGSMVLNTTRAPDAIWTWLKELTTEDAQRQVIQASSRMPATPELAQKLFLPYAQQEFGAEHPDVFMKQWEYGTTHFSSDLTSRLEKEALDPGMKSVMEGQIGVQDGLAEITRLANEILKSSKLASQ